MNFLPNKRYYLIITILSPLFIISGLILTTDNIWAQPRGTVLQEPGWSNMTVPPNMSSTENITIPDTKALDKKDVGPLSEEVPKDFASNGQLKNNDTGTEGSLQNKNFVNNTNNVSQVQ